MLQVSAEMIKELGLSDEELGLISLTITNLAEKARRRRARRASSASGGLVGQVSATRLTYRLLLTFRAAHGSTCLLPVVAPCV